jgi:hypothetical protein
MTRGFAVSAAVLVVALVVAVTMIPRSMRTTQARAEAGSADDRDASTSDGRGFDVTVQTERT